jgi:CTP synthase
VPTDGTGELPDVCVIELGGTVGDIESMPFVEVKEPILAKLTLQAMRQFQFRVGRNNMCIMHVSLVPVLGSVGEQKTKPTQQSVRELRAQGLAPNFIICR